MDSKGHKFLVQSRALKVSKGALVIMKAKRTCYPYNLDGSIHINEVVVVSEEEIKFTCLGINDYIMWKKITKLADKSQITSKFEISKFEFVQTLNLWKAL